MGFVERRRSPACLCKLQSVHTLRLPTIILTVGLRNRRRQAAYVNSCPSRFQGMTNGSYKSVSKKGHTSLLLKKVKHGRDADSKAGQEELYHLPAC